MTPPGRRDLARAAPWTAPGVLILDEAAVEDEGALQAAWRRWLQVFNYLQFLPGQLLATATGLDGDDYAGLVEAGLAEVGLAGWSSLTEAGLELTAASSSSLPPRGGGPGRGGQSGASTAPAQAADQAALNHIWLEVLDQVIGPLQPGLKQLALAGASIPEVGYELTDASSSLPPRGGGPGRGGQSVAATPCSPPLSRGRGWGRGGLSGAATPQVRILAEAELAWPSVRLAVLRPDQEDLAPIWRANGWHVLPLDDSHSLVAGRPWVLAVAERLGLHLSPEA